MKGFNLALKEMRKDILPILVASLSKTGNLLHNTVISTVEKNEVEKLQLLIHAGVNINFADNETGEIPRERRFNQIRGLSGSQ